MTFYELIKLSLEQEAARTEPDGSDLIRKVLEEIEKWKKTH
jgi:hypothetical protein